MCIYLLGKWFSEFLKSTSLAKGWVLKMSRIVCVKHNSVHQINESKVLHIRCTELAQV